MCVAAKIAKKSLKPAIFRFQGGSKSSMLASTGAYFHRAMVASAPGRMTLIGRRPMKNCISDMNLHICSQENQQKLLPPELHFDFMAAWASTQTKSRGGQQDDVSYINVCSA